MGGRSTGATTTTSRTISKARCLKRPAAKAASAPGATGKRGKQRGAESAASASASSASAARAAAERASMKRVTDEVEADDAAEVEPGADDSDDILPSDSQSYWIRVEPAGDNSVMRFHKPFYVVAAASTRVWDLKNEICDVLRIPHRNQKITHRGNSLRNKVIQGMYCQDMIHPLFGTDHPPLGMIIR